MHHYMITSSKFNFQDGVGSYVVKGLHECANVSSMIQVKLVCMSESVFSSFLVCFLNVCSMMSS